VLWNNYNHGRMVASLNKFVPREHGFSGQLRPLSSRKTWLFFRATQAPFSQGDMVVPQGNLRSLLLNKWKAFWDQLCAQGSKGLNCLGEQPCSLRTNVFKTLCDCNFFIWILIEMFFNYKVVVLLETFSNDRLQASIKMNMKWLWLQKY
jgi:hypothetical protein